VREKELNSLSILNDAGLILVTRPTNARTHLNFFHLSLPPVFSFSPFPSFTKTGVPVPTDSANGAYAGVVPKLGWVLATGGVVVLSGMWTLL